MDFLVSVVVFNSLLKESACFKVFAHPACLYRKLWEEVSHMLLAQCCALKSPGCCFSTKTTCLLERREIIFLPSSPSIGFGFGWIGDRSGLDLCAIHPKLKSNDVGKSENIIFTSRLRNQRCLPMKTRTCLSLLISMQIKKILQRRILPLAELNKVS